MNISIIIPIYNASSFLDECLQSYDNYEIICINDGSTDDSGAICERWCKKNKRIRFYSQENKGVSAARNLGLQIAKGAYICFVDADDIVHHNYLKNLIQMASIAQIPICDYTRDLGFKQTKKRPTTTIIPTKRLISAICYEEIKHPNIVCFLFQKDIIDHYSLRFTEGCFINEDFEFYIKYLSYCDGDAALTDYVGYYYRQTKSYLSLTKIKKENLTSIEASKRVGETLFHTGMNKEGDIVYANGVLSYTYFIAYEGNSPLYTILHEMYDVHTSMKTMLKFPVWKKKFLAMTYLIVGRNLFFSLVSSNTRFFHFLRTIFRSHHSLTSTNKEGSLFD